MSSIQEIYLDLLSLRSLLEERAAELVRSIVPQSGEEFDYHSLMPQYGWTPPIWRALFANTRKLAHVRRIKGGPYAVHPTRMALTATHLLADRSNGDGYMDPRTEMTTILAITHDYLEEGGGVSKETFDLFKEELPEQPVAWYGAVVLSEPPMDYESLDRYDQYIIRDAAYLLQLEMALREQGNSLLAECLANTSLLDKFDNLHDLDYITNHPDAKKRVQKLARKMAFYSSVHSIAKKAATGVISDLLEFAMTSQSQSLQLSQEAVGVALSRLGNAREKYGSQIRARAEEVHQTLDLHELFDRKAL